MAFLRPTSTPFLGVKVRFMNRPYGHHQTPAGSTLHAFETSPQTLGEGLRLSAHTLGGWCQGVMNLAPTGLLTDSRG